MPCDDSHKLYMMQQTYELRPCRQEVAWPGYHVVGTAIFSCAAINLSTMVATGAFDASNDAYMAGIVAAAICGVVAVGGWSVFGLDYIAKRLASQAGNRHRTVIRVGDMSMEIIFGEYDFSVELISIEEICLKMYNHDIVSIGSGIGIRLTQRAIESVAQNSVRLGLIRNEKKFGYHFWFKAPAIGTRSQCEQFWEWLVGLDSNIKFRTVNVPGRRLKREHWLLLAIAIIWTIATIIACLG